MNYVSIRHLKMPLSSLSRAMNSRLNHVFVVSIILFCLFGSTLTAGEYSKAIGRIRTLYENMEYDKCLNSIKELEMFKSELSKEELIEVYSYKALSYILTGSMDLAEEVIRDIYRLDPEYLPSEKWAPKLREPFLRIRKEFSKVVRQEVSAPNNTLVVDKNRGTVEEGPFSEGEPNIKYGETGSDYSVGFWGKNILPVSLISTGVGLVATGIVLFVNAKSESSDLRSKLDASEKNGSGLVKDITQAEAKRVEDEINKKYLWGEILSVTGGVLLTGGVVTLILKNTKSDSNQSRLGVVKTDDNSGWMVVYKRDID